MAIQLTQFSHPDPDKFVLPMLRSIDRSTQAEELSAEAYEDLRGRVHIFCDLYAFGGTHFSLESILDPRSAKDPLQYWLFLNAHLRDEVTDLPRIADLVDISWDLLGRAWAERNLHYRLGPKRLTDATLLHIAYLGCVIFPCQLERRNYQAAAEVIRTGTAFFSRLAQHKNSKSTPGLAMDFNEAPHSHWFYTVIWWDVLNLIMLKHSGMDTRKLVFSRRSNERLLPSRES